RDRFPEMRLACHSISLRHRAQFALRRAQWYSRVRFCSVNLKLIESWTFDCRDLSQYFWNTKVASGGIGRLIERELLSQRRLQFIRPRRLGSFSFRRQAAKCWFNCTRIDGLELLDVSHNLGDLRREHPALVVGDVEVRELGD